MTYISASLEAPTTLHKGLWLLISFADFNMFNKTRSWNIIEISLCFTNDFYNEFRLLVPDSHFLRHQLLTTLFELSSPGPFYVIVEYCQYGSLKNFLRTHRQTMCVRTQRTSDENTSEHGQLTSRDLLSFAWQVCKGMRYLCQMKVSTVKFN